MSRVFFDTGQRVAVRESAARESGMKTDQCFVLHVDDQKLQITEATAQLIVTGLQQALAAINRIDPL